MFPFAGAALDLSQRTSAETVGNLTGDGNVTNNVNGFVFGGNNGSGAFGGMISGATGNVTKAGSGTWTLNGSIASATLFSVAGGTVILGTGDTIPNTTPVDVAPGATLNMNNDDEVFGALSGGGFVTNVSTRLELNAATSTTFSGVISGTAAGFINKDGVGTTWTISGANTLPGDWNIRQGTLKLGANVDGISETSTVNISAGAVLDLGGFDEDIGGLSGAGTVSNLSPNLVDDRFSFGANDASTPFSGTIGLGGGLVGVRKTGMGTWTFSGSFGGSTQFEIFGGTVLMNAPGNLNGAWVNISSGEILDLNGTAQTINLSGAGNVNRNLNASGLSVSGGDYSGMISGAGPVNKVGNGVWTISGAPALSSRLNIQAGTVRLSGGADILGLCTDVDINAGATFDMNGFRASIDQLSGAGAVINNTHANGLSLGNCDGTFTFTGSIDGTARVLKNGTGVWTLDGSIGGGGDVFVNSGTFRLGSTADLATTCDVTVSAGAFFDMNNSSESMGALLGSGNTINHSAALTLNVAADALYTGVISPPAGAPPNTGNVAKRGAAIWTLGNAQQFTGVLDIDAGTVLLGAGGNLASTVALNVDTGATFDMGGRAQTVRRLSGEGSVINANNTAGGGLIINGTENDVFSGVISGAGRVTKSGTGRENFSGANTYSGPTTINGGALLANNTTGSATGTGAVTVSNAAVLGGGGVVSGAVTVSGGAIAPGGTHSNLSGAGSLGLGSTVSFNSTAHFIIEIGGVSPGTQYDQLIALGNATLNGTLDVSIINGFVPSNGQTFTILTAGGRSGTFATTNMPPGFAVSYQGSTVILNFTGTGLRADTNCDNVINNLDIDPFVLALTNPVAYHVAFPSCDINHADVNNDGLINNLDIDPFVICLTNGGCP